jgi:hypothetical protein
VPSYAQSRWAWRFALRPEESESGGPSRLRGVGKLSFSNLALADVTEDVLRQLIAEGETDLVERKERPPDGGLGPTVASFANSGGGWVLLGVTNDGKAKGCQAPGKAEPQDWLRTAIRKDVDPLPPFEARSVAIDGVEIIVIRVLSSTLTPHLYTPAGAVYIREHGGRHPIKSQAKLLELAMSPEQAKAAAIQRMLTLPLVVQALGNHDLGQEVNGQTRVADWMVTAGPLMVPAPFRQRTLSESVVKKANARLNAKLKDLGPPDMSWTHARPGGKGVSVEGRNQSNGNELHLLVDGGGVAVGRMRFRLTRGVCHPGTTADDILTPLLMLVLDTLADCGASGTTHLHLHLRITATDGGWEPSLTLQSAHETGELHAPPGAEVFLGEDIELPASLNDAKAVAEVWMRELAREAGISWWEPELT